MLRDRNSTTNTVVSVCPKVLTVMYSCGTVMCDGRVVNPAGEEVVISSRGKFSMRPYPYSVIAAVG